MVSISSRIASGLAAGVASAVLVAMAVPVGAATLAKDGEAPVTAAAPTDGKITPRKEVRYCIIHTPTGSMLPNKICKTKAEWAAEDVDITAKQ
jgi:hypothetical protein